ALAERHAQHGHLEPASAIRVTDSAALPRLTAVELQRSARLERARKAVAIAVGAAVVLLAFTVLLAVAQWATPDETESEFRLTEGAIPPHLVASAAGSQATRRERKERERQA